MERIIAIDYGSKRCGVAVSDPLQIIAGALETVPSHELMHFLEDYISREHVEGIVFGKPMQTNNRVSQSFILVEQFANACRKKFPDLFIDWEDERFTSKMASQAMVQGGMKKSQRRQKGQVDKISAAIILQSYLDRKKG